MELRRHRGITATRIKKFKSKVTGINFLKQETENNFLGRKGYVIRLFCSLLKYHKRYRGKKFNLELARTNFFKHSKIIFETNILKRREYVANFLFCKVCKNKRRYYKKRKYSRTLPDHIIFQNILVRLPPKCLVKFQCVSKTWLSTITHPSFVRIHLGHVSASTSYSKSHFLITPDFLIPFIPPPVACSLVCGDTYEEVEPKFPHQVESSLNYNLIGSVNGLVCFALDERFYIWNPFIRVGKVIPNDPNGFSGRRSTQCMGFGFDPLDGDYKIIVIPLLVLSSSCRPFSPTYKPRGDGNIYMYSLNTNIWKPVPTPDEFRKNFVYEYDQGICLNGTINWLASTKGNNTIRRIVSFNFEQECFQDIMLPDYRVELPDDFGPSTAFSIQVIQHSIHLSIIPRKRSHCHIWMLKNHRANNAESWESSAQLYFLKVVLKSI